MKLDIQVEESSRRALEQAFKQAPQKTVNGIRGWVNRTAARTVREGVTASPVQTGDLNRSIQAKFAKAGLEANVKPTSNHALYVHEGTGIHGPKKRPITPRKGKALSWVGSGGRIFARSVKGQKPQPFMNEAYKAVKPVAERDAMKTLDEIVRSI